MAVSRSKVWAAGEVLTAADLNAEFNNLIANGEDLGSPRTKALDLNGQNLIIDADADSYLTEDSDDVVLLRLQGVDLFYWDGDATSPVNGLTFTASATGTAVVIAATGTDTNIPVTVSGKGTGHVTLGQATSTDVRLAADQPIADSSGNELIAFSKTASAVNEVTATNAATGSGPSLTATGGDTNIDLTISGKGTGQTVVQGAFVQPRAQSELTIATGVIVPTQTYHTVDTESDAATDDLDTITSTNIPDGSFITLRAENAARTVVVQHEAGGSGQIHLKNGADFYMETTAHAVCLQRRGTDFYEVGREFNGIGNFPGESMEWNGTTLPTGWLWEDGDAISRTTYAGLFAAIGTTFGVGDGSTTFNVPDSAGRVAAGRDDMSGTSANRLTDQSGGLNGDTLGDTGGAETHTLQTAEMPAHAHTGPWGGTQGVTAGGVTLRNVNTDNTSTVGGGGAHNNVQPTIIKNKIIFAGV